MSRDGRSRTRRSPAPPRRARRPLARDDRLVAVQQDAVLAVVAQAAREDRALDVAGVLDHLLPRVAVVDADDVLFDDGAGVELLADVVAGGADELHAALVGPVGGARAADAGEGGGGGGG